MIILEYIYILGQPYALAQRLGTLISDVGVPCAHIYLTLPISQEETILQYRQCYRMG